VLLALARLIEPIPASGDAFSEFMLDMAETQQAEAARAAFYRRHGHQPPWYEPRSDPAWDGGGDRKRFG
jgi:hypothetical protein